MTWLIIIAVIVVIVGPAMYLLPNAKDKRLTALRLDARAQGLNVEITSLPKLDPTADERVSAGGVARVASIRCVAYQVQVNEEWAWGQLLIQRKPEHPGVPVHDVLPGWVIDPAQVPLWSQLSADGQRVAAVHEACDKLPVDTQALGLDDRFISCYWLEKTAADTSVVADIATTLKHLRGVLAPGN